MAPLHCCGFRRSFSPELEPVRLVDASQTTRGRFPLSSHASSIEMSDVRPIREIFISASNDDSSHETAADSAHGLCSHRGKESNIQHSGSSRLLPKVASQVRKRMSRDSALSRRSSTKMLRSSLSAEDIERRNELKRALHQRVEDNILEDFNTSDNSYDEDAVPIKTPVASWGRHESVIQISPKPPHKVPGRLDDPSYTSHTELQQRDISQSYVPKSAAMTLSRILTQRASHLLGESEDQVANALAESPERQRSAKRYIFNDEDTPKKVSGSRTPSPLTRANTVIRVAPSTKPMETAFKKPAFLDTLETPSSADHMPIRLESTSDSIARGERRIPFSERCKDRSPAELGVFHNPRAGAPLPPVYDTKIRPASEQWLHGASRLLGPNILQKLPSHADGANTNNGSHHYDPKNEETSFGGIDGDDDSPPESAYVTARTRNHSEGSETGHLYNMHIPRRLASNSLLPSASLPQLQEPHRKRSYVCGDSADFFAKPRRQASTPEIMTPKIPIAWNNAGRRTTSSVYSSQPESLLSSRRNSMLCIPSLQDRVHQQFKDHQVCDNIVSISPKRTKSVDLERLERRTGSTSFHSSNESLTNKELAAAERRISVWPRANTLPRNSRFKEDLDRISAELALTNPPRRRFSYLDGNGDWRSPSVASGIDEATSIWEKALREHAREDAALSHTRLGSYSPGPDHLGPTDIGPRNEASSSRRPSSRPSALGGQNHLSVGGERRSDLQARLAAYKLPTYVQAPKKHPLLNEAKRCTSAYPIGSWARYPSHSRPERSSSPAGLPDQVIARDFADMTFNSSPRSSPSPQGSQLASGEKSKSLFLPKNMITSLTRLYKSQSQELQRMLANESRGHRSSISQGAVVEYPELEMLGSLRPPLPSPDIGAKVAFEDIMKSMPAVSVSRRRIIAPTTTTTTTTTNSETDMDAKGWSRLYDDCVVAPSPSLGEGNSRADSRVELGVGVGSREAGVRGVGDGKVEGSGSSEMRASTLDFKRSLEVDEGLARERVLELVGRLSR